MAERITITPEELRNSAAKFTEKSEETREMLTFLRSEVDGLESTWAGMAQSSFFNEYTEMEQTLQQFPDVLDGINSQLTTVAETLEETDEQLGASLTQ